METCHANDSDVEDYVNKIDVRERDEKLTKIRNLGNFVHNKKVLAEEKRDFHVTHRPSEDVGPDAYDFCKFCFETGSNMVSC